MFDLLIRGGTVVLPSRVHEIDIGIKDGKIAGLLGSGQNAKAQKIIDVTGLVIMPGVVDPHVHMREPGKTDQEDFASGTRAAVVGGVTTVLEHPNTIPIVATKEDLLEKKNIIQPKSYVDFGLYGAGGVENLSEIPRLVEAGVVGFKIFMQNPPKGKEKELERLHVTDDGKLLDIMQKIAGTSRPLAVHAENGSIVDHRRGLMGNEGDIKGDAHARSRPVVAEEEAVSRACIFAKASGCRVHIPHASSGSAVLAGVQAQKAGAKVTIETCPQYLFFSMEDLNRVGPYAKIDPPLRSRHEQDLLWRCIQEGAIDCVGSDHAPHDFSLKEKGWDDIFIAPSGIPGVELLLPLMLTAVQQKRIDLPLVSRLTARNPALIFGLYPAKGEIKIGADADLAIVDLNYDWQINSSKLITKSKNTAQLFDGLKVTGRPLMTIIRGTMVAREGETLVSPGFGQWLKPSDMRAICSAKSHPVEF